MADEGQQERRSAGDSARVREFLELNRLRFGRSRMSPEQLERWELLRWGIEASLSGPESAERRSRRALRVPTDLPVDVSNDESPEPEVGARAREIAERGLFLATGSPPAVGTRLRLRLHDDHGETTEVEGVVVWAREADGPDGPAGAGVEFAKLDPGQREAVAFLVAEALAAL